jgi:hypothetical protein
MSIKSRAHACNEQIFTADIVINETLPLGLQDELSNTLGARETTLHEFGHALGAYHEDDEFAVMCSSDSCGKVGRWSIFGSAGNRTESIMPDDADFGLVFHGTSAAGLHDPTPSPWEHNGSSASLIYGIAGTTVTMCPGDAQIFEYGLANLGKKNATGSNEVTLDIVFSTNSIISVSDTPMALGNFIEVSRGQFKDVTTVLTVPSLSTGTYNVGVVADPDQDLTEQDEFNNSTQSGLTVIVPSGC